MFTGRMIRLSFTAMFKAPRSQRPRAQRPRAQRREPLAQHGRFGELTGAVDNCEVGVESSSALQTARNHLHARQRACMHACAHGMSWQLAQ